MIISDGKNWTNQNKDNYNAVQAKGKDSIWAVGANGLVARYINPLDLVKLNQVE
ncbi:MAG TPA: hypothetical protein PKY82_08740 [Pyrinomonadaceae bacterium]|nr:hypothetical protein [Pyrinomonadaceae bacterium]